MARQPNGDGGATAPAAEEILQLSKDFSVDPGRLQRILERLVARSSAPTDSEPRDFATGADLPTTAAELPTTGAERPATGAELPVTGAELPATGADLAAAGAELPAQQAKLSPAGVTGKPPKRVGGFSR